MTSSMGDFPSSSALMMLSSPTCTTNIRSEYQIQGPGTRFGHLYPGRQRTGVRYERGLVEPCPSRSTTQAVTHSPHRSSGTPATATSATDGCPSSAISTSRGTRPSRG